MSDTKISFLAELLPAKTMPDDRESLPVDSDDAPERWATVNRWVEELGISQPTISRRLKGILGITGRDNMGRILETAFYPESLVRERCGDLLGKVQQAGDDGFFTLNGQQYGTARAWERVLHVGQGTVRTRLGDVTGITGKDNSGHLHEDAFYPESIVHERCSDLLTEMPRAGADGFFTVNGERYGTVGAWKRILRIGSAAAIRWRLKGILGITGKDGKSHIVKNAFYSESLVRDRLKDFLTEMLQAGADGFFTLNGERYGTAEAWARDLPVNRKSIQKRLQGIQGMTGKDSVGHVLEHAFFPESLVRERCKDLLERRLSSSDNDEG